jgi:large subunit ribosomal protein L15
MKIHELTLQSSRKPKRVGRGISAGGGKTAGRGTKGQNARTGGGVRPGFEGGQNPLAKRLPKKRGFTPLARIEYQIINLSSLAHFKADTNAGPAEFAAIGLIKHADRRVKLLAAGELSTKLTLKVHHASAAAKIAVEKAGGSVEIIKFVKAPSKKATRPVAETPAAKSSRRGGHTKTDSTRHKSAPAPKSEAVAEPSEAAAKE